MLAIQASNLIIEVELDVAGEERRLVGQLIPPQTAQIEVLQSGATRQAEADATGWFVVSGLEAWPVSLRCRLPGQDPVAAWVVVVSGRQGRLVEEPADHR